MTDAPGPAQAYASITKGVDKLVQEHTPDDPDQGDAMVARAALLRVRHRAGPTRTFEILALLAKELCGEVLR